MEPVENAYFNWLCAKVTRVRRPTPSQRFDRLLRIMHTTEFVWVVPGDQHRAADGVELRQEFAAVTSTVCEESWVYLPCSVLEMMIGLSRRAEFITDMDAADWFWVFVMNIGLYDFTDASDAPDYQIQEALDRLVWRRYFPDGHGGMFPRAEPEEDQRTVELWYQLSGYVIEHELHL